VFDPPGEMDTPHSGRGGVQVAFLLRAGEAIEERGQVAKLPRRPSFQFPSAAGDDPRGRQIALAQGAGELEQRVTIGAKAGDHEAGVRSAVDDQWPGRNEQVHALRGDEFPDIADNPIPGGVGCPDGLRRVGFPAPGGRVRLHACCQRTQPILGLPGRAGVEPADVDTWREEAGASRKVRQTDDLPQALGGMA